eukprot:1048175-Prymnesium_polylepis.2
MIRLLTTPRSRRAALARPFRRASMPAIRCRRWTACQRVSLQPQLQIAGRLFVLAGEADGGHVPEHHLGSGRHRRSTLDVAAKDAAVSPGDGAVQVVRAVLADGAHE